MVCANVHIASDVGELGQVCIGQHAIGLDENVSANRAQNGEVDPDEIVIGVDVQVSSRGLKQWR